jgi:hypothetical protein
MEAGLRERRNPKEWETKTSFEEVTAWEFPRIDERQKSSDLKAQQILIREGRKEAE